jgi:hypothetical protein
MIDMVVVESISARNGWTVLKNLFCGAFRMVLSQESNWIGLTTTDPTAQIIVDGSLKKKIVIIVATLDFSLLSERPKPYLIG